MGSSIARKTSAGLHAALHSCFRQALVGEHGGRGGGISISTWRLYDCRSPRNFGLSIGHSNPQRPRHNRNTERRASNPLPVCLHVNAGFVQRPAFEGGSFELTNHNGRDSHAGRRTKYNSSSLDSIDAVLLVNPPNRPPKSLTRTAISATAVASTATFEPASMYSTPKG